MKIVVLSPKSLFKYDDLITKLEDAGAVFYEDTQIELPQISDFYSDEEVVLGFDEMNVKGSFEGLNQELPKLKNVSTICGLSARYHELDLEKLKEAKITYCNNPDTTSQSVAEIAMMHLFILARYQPLFHTDKLNFYGSNKLGRELASLSAGILGFGSIGSRIAKMCTGVGMEVKIWSRTKKESDYPQVELQELLKQDVIFISIASGDDSSKLFNQAFFDSLKPHQYLIDIVADDKLYDKNMTIQLVKEGMLAGFGFEAESPQSKYVDTKDANISISPHVGWGTQESYRKLYEDWTNTILAAANGKPINIVRGQND